MLVNALDLPAFASCPHRLLFSFLGGVSAPFAGASIGRLLFT
jgi:hypothetical protein